MSPIIRKQLSRHWPCLLWCAVGLILFWPVLPYYLVLPSPDSAPFYPAAFRLRHLDLLLSGDHAVAPHDLLTLLLPPLVMHDMTYLIDTLLIAAGCAYLLRGRGIPNAAAWFGGGVLAFAGYSFTLVSAGHRGFFHMGVYVIFMLAFVLRAMLHGRAAHFALAALCAGWALRFAPDFSVPYFMLAAAYALWLLLSNAAGQPWKTRLRRLAVGLPVAALCLAVTGYPSFTALTTTHLRTREAQIAQASAAQPALSGAEAAAAAERDKWIFATNWSLPPEEIVEFVAPCIFGTQTGDPRAPYWGRLGRTEGWEQHGQGFPNFRQHTVYLGAIPLCLAALAVAFAWRLRRYRSAAGSDDGRGELSAWLSDVPFWTAVAIVALLLAFGRHAPFYRLFYSLPYMSLLRAPVKFVRFVELAVALLAATGAACLCNNKQSLGEGVRWRRWAGTALALAVLAAGATAAIAARPDFAATTLTRLNLGSWSAPLRHNAVQAALHAVLAFGVLAAALAAAGARLASGKKVLALLIGWTALDAVWALNRFVQPVDVTPWYAPNLVTRLIEEADVPAPVVANYASPNYMRDWFTSSLRYRGIGNCVPSPDATRESPLFLLAAQFGNDPVRCWELGGASFAIVPAAGVSRLPRSRVVPLAALNIAAGRVTQATTARDSFALLRLAKPLPYAWLSPDWIIVAADRHPTALRDDPNTPVNVAVITGDCPPPAADGGAPGSVSVEAVQYAGGSLATRLAVATTAPRLLTVRIHDDPGLEALLDGQAVPLLRSGHLWSGVHVPAGRHRVTIRSVRRPVVPLAELVLVAIVLAWTAVPHLRRAAGKSPATSDT